MEKWKHYKYFWKSSSVSDVRIIRKVGYVLLLFYLAAKKNQTRRDKDDVTPSFIREPKKLVLILIESLTPCFILFLLSNGPRVNKNKCALIGY